MMKIKVKATGEVFNVTEWAKIPTEICDSWGNPVEFNFDDVEFIQDTTPKAVDWEQRRYEIAKRCVAALMNNEITLDDAAKISVEQADALIAELKK